MMLPTEYAPTTPAEFVGPARDAAEKLDKIIASAQAHDFAPIKVFYGGPSGTGKTALVNYGIRRLGVTKWAVQEYNGTDITIDRIREIEGGLHLTVNEMFGDYRVIAIHEADRVTDAAQVKMLTLLDNLPRRTAVFCTTNKALKAMEERFQRRFKYTQVTGAPAAEIEALLSRFDLPPAVAKSIAMGACGNVAVALIEAEEWLQTKEAA